MREKIKNIEELIKTAQERETDTKVKLILKALSQGKFLDYGNLPLNPYQILFLVRERVSKLIKPEEIDQNAPQYQDMLKWLKKPEEEKYKEFLGNNYSAFPSFLDWVKAEEKYFNSLPISKQVL